MKDTYETQNLDEASYLLYKLFPIQGKKPEGNKITIAFENSRRLQTALVDYVNGTNVEPRAFLEAYRRVREFVFDPKKKFTWRNQ